MTAMSMLDNGATKEYLERVLLAHEIDRVDAEKEKLHQESKKLQWDAHREERQNRDKDSEKQYENIYTFSDKIEQATVKKAMEEMGMWTRRNPDMGLEVVLNSPGGEVLQGLALYDFLRLLQEKVEVTVTALGTAASMGSVILQAGTTRRMGSNAWLLIHEVNKGAIGNVSELKNELEFAESLWENITEILAERSTLSARQIRNKAKNKDWWMNAKEALKYGFVDEII